MKKVLLLSMLLVSFNLLAGDLYVLPGAGSAPGYYNTIQDALIAAEDGDNIHISPGEYVENLAIYQKSVNLVPFEADDSYEVIGNFVISFFQEGTGENIENLSNDYGDGMYEVTISGLSLNGNFDYEGTSNPLGIYYMISFIDCEFLGDVIVENAQVDSYYSYFRGSTNRMKNCKNFIGNTVDPSSLSDNFRNFDFGPYQHGIFHQNEDPVRIIANKFYNSQIRLDLGGNTCYSVDYEVVLGGGNYGTNNSDICSNEFLFANNYAFIDPTWGPLFNVVETSSEKTAIIKLLNNTLYHRNTNPSTSNNSQGTFFRCQSSSGIQMLEISNNILFTQFGSYVSAFWVDNIPAVFVENNIFSEIPSLCSDANEASSGEWSNGGIFYYNANSNVTLIHENNTNLNNGSYPSPSSEGTIAGLFNNYGVYLGQLSDVLDGGIDEIEYRDIDDTQNDIGPTGGPYTIYNYFDVNNLLSPNSYKARVVNLDIPTTIYGLPGISEYQVKSKAVITNE